MTSGTPPADAYRPGDVLAERYRIERTLGRGGMGVVLAARHIELDTLVAIKLLLPEVLNHEDIVARFLREARAAVRIKSEHVARVTDVGSLPSGSPYMVMEYLEGTDLSELVRQHGPLPVPQAVDYVLQASEAIAEAHSLGIVHRDLKPGNLFLSRRADGSELIKVLDFGISKFNDAGTGQNASLTRTSTLLGSPTYMSPEQLTSSRRVDARTDIWSLGIIIHELLSGEAPFRADTMPELFVAILQSPPHPLPALQGIAPELEAVILRCLRKSRDERFTNIGELAAALLPFAPPSSRVSVERITRLVSPRSNLPSDKVTPSAVDATVVPGRETQKSWGRTASKTQTQFKGRRLLLLGASATLAILGVVAFVALRWAAAPAPGESNHVPSSSGAVTADASARVPSPELDVVPVPPSAVRGSTAIVKPAPSVEPAPSTDASAPSPGSASSGPTAKRPSPPPHRLRVATPGVTPAPTAPAASTVVTPAPRAQSVRAPTPSDDWEEDRH